MNYTGFLKKEFSEIYKTHKKVVLPSIFFVLGMAAPLISRYMNLFFRFLGRMSDGRVEMKILQKATYLDSYTQFFGNFTQIISIVIIFAFMGVVSEEKLKGTVVLVIAKPVSRLNFILSKFVAGLALLTFAYFVAVITFIYYNLVLFHGFKLKNAYLALFSLYVFYIFILTVVIFASTVSKSNMLSAVIGFGIMIGTVVFSKIPVLGNYSPGSIGELGLKVVKGIRHPSILWMPLGVTFFVIVLLIVFSILIFRWQDL